MDYKTAAMCYYRLKNKRAFTLGAARALANEVRSSTVLQQDERRSMLDALNGIADRRQENAEYLRRLWKLLAAHQEFRKAWWQLLSAQGTSKRRASND
jgi:hypothetical protein